MFEEVSFAEELQFEDALFGFIDEEVNFCASYTNVAPVIVERTGDPSCEAEIMYNTRDNTAIAGTHYDQCEGELVFKENEMSKVIQVPLIDDAKYDEPLSFTVELGYCSLGDEAVALYETKVILEPTSENLTMTAEYNDDPGVIGFRTPKIELSDVCSADNQNVKIDVPVDRTEGTVGDVSVDYFTRDNTAIAGVHYVETQGELPFKNGQSENSIVVDILPHDPHYNQISFNVELGGTTGDADVGYYETEVVLKVRNTYARD